MMFEFVPNRITVKKGERVKLLITSTDVEHGLRIDALGVKVAIPPGQTSEVLLAPTEAGWLLAECSVFCGPGHRHMELAIKVTP